jgi:hypothetical protein
MSKNTCFLIFIVALVTIMASFIFNFAPITSPVSEVFGAMRHIYTALAALLIALILIKQKHYWLLVLGCAVVAAVLIQLFVIGGSLLSLMLLYRLAAIVIYAYLVVLIRYML